MGGCCEAGAGRSMQGEEIDHGIGIEIHLYWFKG